MAPLLDREPKRHEKSAHKKGSARPLKDPAISALEADLAYFHARLEWIGKKPKTRNQKAQLHTFRVLISSVIKNVIRLKRKAVAKT